MGFMFVLMLRQTARAVAEGHLGMLHRAVGVIPADPGGEPEGLFEKPQRGGVSVVEVKVHRRRHAAPSCCARRFATLG